MSRGALARRLPGPLRRQVLHFEAAIEAAVGRFSSCLAEGCRVLDAGAGEGQYKPYFKEHRYVAVDLGVGDSAWNYRGLDVVADLAALPLASSTFDACLNVVTLEHVKEPAAVLAEISRVLRPGGELLLVVPQDWEVHQPPHDYFRYTCHGVQYLLEKNAFTSISIQPVGGFFRLLSRRLWNSLEFLPAVLFPIAAALVAPAALLLPALEPLDRTRTFTLGYICSARKPR